MQGNLKDMAVADLIQHNCLDGKTALLRIHKDQQEALVYFDAGEVTHAVLDQSEGEEVIYQILFWNEGDFQLIAGENTPERTITRNWTGLLLEGARLMDEGASAGEITCDQCGELLNARGYCSNPNCKNYVSDTEDSTESQKNSNSVQNKENNKMAKTRGERLADALNEMLADSSDINGAAIVGHDGLVYSANVPQKALDEEMVGAVSASVFGLSRRSAEQLQRGDLVRSLIQGSDGNIIVSAINDETLLVALTAADVNLGMAFMEIRSMVKTLADLL